jgi:peroxiredoxin
VRFVEPTNLLTVDWSTLPAPHDDGAASHLAGLQLPDVVLAATDGSSVNLGKLSGRTVVYIYPLTGQPGNALPAGWDEIPGARGCTPQSCAFRDHYADLTAAGAERVFGLSSQDTPWQQEAAERLHLPFTLLSDSDFMFADALRLPSFRAQGTQLLKRMALVIDDGRITRSFYPVFPPDRNAGDVLAWLKDNRR